MKSSSTNSKTNNSNDHDDSNDMIMENNGNIFLSKFSKMSINDNSNRGSDNLRIIHQCQIHYCIIQEKHSIRTYQQQQQQQSKQS